MIYPRNHPRENNSARKKMKRPGLFIHGDWEGISYTWHQARVPCWAFRSALKALF
jgi:hypothetical protein